MHKRFSVLLFLFCSIPAYSGILSIPQYYSESEGENTHNTGESADSKNPQNVASQSSRTVIHSVALDEKHPEILELTLGDPQRTVRVKMLAPEESKYLMSMLESSTETNTFHFTFPLMGISQDGSAIMRNPLNLEIINLAGERTNFLKSLCKQVVTSLFEEGRDNMEKAYAVHSPEENIEMIRHAIDHFENNSNSHHFAHRLLPFLQGSQKKEYFGHTLKELEDLLDSLALDCLRSEKVRYAQLYATRQQVEGAEQRYQAMLNAAANPPTATNSTLSTAEATSWMGTLTGYLSSFVSLVVPPTEQDSPQLNTTTGDSSQLGAPLLSTQVESFSSSAVTKNSR